MKKIGIIGSGISGLSTAFYLSKSFDVSLFEKSFKFGGHANTYEFVYKEKNILVDTGFIVYNNKNYPNFVKILNHLNVKSSLSNMSFSMSVDKKLEYSGSIRGMLANYKNLVDKQYYKMALDITRFYKKSGFYLNKSNKNLSLGEFLKEFNFSDYFKSYHIVPMASAIWSSPEKEILDFPIRSLLDFYNNHQLLNFVDRPKWRTISNGSESYVKNILNHLKKHKVNLNLNNEIKEISKTKDKIIITNNKDKSYEFDYLVFANHTDQAAKILKNFNKYLSNSLKKFRYQKNLAYLHFDQSIMPKNKSIWSSWNYSTNSTQNISCITYWMNKLQNLNTKKNIFVTLNPIVIPEETKIIKVFKYEHPIYNQNALEIQKLIDDRQGVNKIFFTGAWNGYGFHEDGVNSALKIAKLLNVDLSWIN